MYSSPNLDKSKQLRVCRIQPAPLADHYLDAIYLFNRHFCHHLRLRQSTASIVLWRLDDWAKVDGSTGSITTVSEQSNFSAPVFSPLLVGFLCRSIAMSSKLTTVSIFDFLKIPLSKVTLLTIISDFYFLSRIELLEHTFSTSHFWTSKVLDTFHKSPLVQLDLDLALLEWLAVSIPFCRLFPDFARVFRSTGPDLLSYQRRF